MSNLRQSMSVPPAAPWSGGELQDLFTEVIPELVDIARFAATVTGEPEIARRLEARLPGPYSQDFVDALIGVLQHMFPLRFEGLVEALRRASMDGEADTKRSDSEIQ